MVNKATFLSFFGYAIYVFEGIGVIIPIMETHRNPHTFKRILQLVLLFLAVLYVLFGNFEYFVWGVDNIKDDQLILDALPAAWPVFLI